MVDHKVVYTFNTHTPEDITALYFTAFGAVLFASCLTYIVLRAILGRR